MRMMKFVIIRADTGVCPYGWVRTPAKLDY